MKYVEIGKHLVVDPRVCHGKLTFKGTRVPVETVLNWLGKGESLDSMLSSWPELSREAVAEATKLAAEALTQKAQAEAQDESIHRGRPTRRRSSA